MKMKYFFILALAILLSLTVYKMMEYETSLRKERKVTLIIEDKSKPLFTKLSENELKAVARKSEYNFMTNRDYFSSQMKHYNDSVSILVWEKIFLKGVNLGVAMPGKFPAEFSLSFSEYLEWLVLIGNMNANTIRVYTILPPQFYQALSYYNFRHNDHPLYLMQGVWTEVPEDENYYNEDFERDFDKEIIDAINVIHGNTVLSEKPGKASGIYSVDVSKYTIALLLGREWEPASVWKTNQVNNIHHFNGEFIQMNEGKAMEAWLAERMNFAIVYETQQYVAQRPISFVNWLPLDPMYHNTELIENKKVKEYDNDLESIDFSKFHSTELFEPGIFAAYHVYPYYPDFIYLQHEYTDSLSPEGQKDPYYFYLKDLKNRNPEMPLIIAEYGLPSSRGNSHFSPFKMHQGGHSEKDQATLSLQLTSDIVNAECAGALYFEWIDEWFKHNWLVMDFEQPADNRKLWHNMENPEQNFGIIAVENKTRTIDGKLDDWKSSKMAGDQVNISFHADATYFYIALTLPHFSFSTNSLYIAIDTYDQQKGDHRLPFINQYFEPGFEFLAEFFSTDSSFLQVDEPYSVFTDIYNGYIPAYASSSNENGQFVRQYMLTNRKRESLTGEKTDSVVIDRSRLIFGNSYMPDQSNSDWFFDSETGILELRFDWHLLNVTDPSKRYVLNDNAQTPDIDYIQTEGFNLIAFITDKNNQVINKLPSSGTFHYSWDEWEVPKFSQRQKPVYFALQEYFEKITIPDQTEINNVNEKFLIADFYNNKKGAATISFINASYSQYEFGLPILKKYAVNATFGIYPDLIVDSENLTNADEILSVKRLKEKEINEISLENEIAVQFNERHDLSKVNLHLLTQNLNYNICTAILDKPSKKNNLPGIIFAMNEPGTSISDNSYEGIQYSSINGNISLVKLDSIIQSKTNSWIVLNYYQLSSDDSISGMNMKPAKEPVVENSLFDKQIRLLRNNEFWITSQANVFKYLKEKQNSVINFEKHNNIIFLSVNNSLNGEIYNQPLTIEFTTGAKRIKIKGSEADGIYMNKSGHILINLIPNKEIILELIE